MKTNKDRQKRLVADAQKLAVIAERGKLLQAKANLAVKEYQQAIDEMAVAIDKIFQDRLAEINADDEPEPETAAGNTVTVYHREGRRHETISVKINGIHLSGGYISLHGFVHGSQSRYKIDMVGVPSPLFSKIHKSIFGYGAFGEMFNKDFTENATLTFDCTAVSIIEIGSH